MTTTQAPPEPAAQDLEAPPMTTLPAVVHIGNPAPLPPPKSFGEIIAELTDPKALQQHTAMMAAYDAAVHALVTEADVQVEGGREFKKKSAWRKLAQYFRVSTEIVRNERWWELDENTGDKHLVARVVVRGSAPWGQIMEAVGLCSTRELRFTTIGVTCPSCGGPMWDNRQPGKSRNGEAFRCKDNSCGYGIMPGEFDESLLRRRPNPTAVAKADHDCEATAATRATNRAISDLIAAGEVSAEEVEGGSDVRGEGRKALPPLERRAFGKDWKDKTWQQVLESEDGRNFADWAVNNADRLADDVRQALKAELERISKAVLAQARAARGEQQQPQNAPGAGQAQKQPEQPVGEQGAPQARTQRHQQALLFLSNNGRNMPEGISYAGELVQTDNLLAWIRSNWHDLHEPDSTVEELAVEAAIGAAAWMRLNKVAYKGDPPAAKAEQAPPPPSQAGTNQRLISEAQIKRLIAIGKNEGRYSDAGLRQLIADHGFEHYNEIPKGPIYDKIVAEAGDSTRGGQYNDAAAEQAESQEMT